MFPAKNRDNFGTAVGFIEGNAIWNIGDRNGMYANAWVDPFEFGTRYWEVGTFFYRDDRTSLSLAYKHVDPIQSRLVSASANYVFSPKYAMTALTTYDFGYQSSLTNSLLFTRVGTDMAVTVGFTLQLAGQKLLAGCEHRPEPDRQPAVAGAVPVRRVRRGREPVRVQTRAATAAGAVGSAGN